MAAEMIYSTRTYSVLWSFWAPIIWRIGRLSSEMAVESQLRLRDSTRGRSFCCSGSPYFDLGIDNLLFSVSYADVLCPLNQTFSASPLQHALADWMSCRLWDRCRIPPPHCGCVWPHVVPDPCRQPLSQPHPPTFSGIMKAMIRKRRPTNSEAHGDYPDPNPCGCLKLVCQVTFLIYPQHGGTGPWTV